METNSRTAPERYHSSSALVAFVPGGRLGGQLGDRVAKRISASRLYVPDHLRVEVDSALRGLDVQGLLTPEQANAARVVALDIRSIFGRGRW